MLGFQNGMKVFIRTVTYFYTGVVRSVDDGAVCLASAAWIADTGRFHDALKKSEFDEVEPYPGDVHVSLASIVDWCEITKVPTEQK